MKARDPTLLLWGQRLVVDMGVADEYLLGELHNCSSGIFPLGPTVIREANFAIRILIVYRSYHPLPAPNALRVGSSRGG
jgi:hypothetical protein